MTKTYSYNKRAIAEWEEEVIRRYGVFLILGILIAGIVPLGMKYFLPQSFTWKIIWISWILSLSVILISAVTIFPWIYKLQKKSMETLRLSLVESQIFRDKDGAPRLSIHKEEIQEILGSSKGLWIKGNNERMFVPKTVDNFDDLYLELQNWHPITAKVQKIDAVKAAGITLGVSVFLLGISVRFYSENPNLILAGWLLGWGANFKLSYRLTDDTDDYHDKIRKFVNRLNIFVLFLGVLEWVSRVGLYF